VQSLDSRLEFAVDPDSEPVDLEQAIASFLLRYVRSVSAVPVSSSIISAMVHNASIIPSSDPPVAVIDIGKSITDEHVTHR